MGDLCEIKDCKCCKEREYVWSQYHRVKAMYDIATETNLQLSGYNHFLKRKGDKLASDVHGIIKMKVFHLRAGIKRFVEEYRGADD